MKKLTTTILIILLGIVLFSGCKKEDDEPGNTTTFTAKIDGVTFTAATAVVTQTGSFYSISGHKDDNNQITLNVPGLNTSTYTEDVPDQVIALCVQSGIDYYSGSGDYTITISEYSDSKVSGTFSFTGTEQTNSTTVSVTEGQFNNVPLQ